MLKLHFRISTEYGDYEHYSMWLYCISNPIFAKCFYETKSQSWCIYIIQYYHFQDRRGNRFLSVDAHMDCNSYSTKKQEKSWGGGGAHL